MTECMKPGCEKTAEQYKKTNGFFYDDYRCFDHASEDHIPIEEAPASIQRIHEEAKE